MNAQKFYKELKKCPREMKIIETYKLYDIPTTMVKTFEEIVKKHPSKPLFIMVWDWEKQK
jgi:orotidine-5'-phosphate decarboxylase